MNIFNLGLDSKGNPPEKARTVEDWDEWQIEMKAKHPIKYFFKEEFEPMFVWPITSRVKSVRDWIRFRTYDRYHIVRTGEKPDYMESFDRMFYTSFNLLKDFVEVEKANMQRWSYPDEWTKRRIKREGATAGIEYLKWEMTLDTQQAVDAKEIYDLYVWWVNIRPNRKKPWEGSEWDRYHKLCDEVYEGKFSMSQAKHTPEMEELWNTLSDASSNLEKLNAEEDDKMFTRLVAIRRAMWT